MTATAPDPATTGPPYPSSAGRDLVAAGSLPAELTSFVGRRRELAAVRRSLGGARLLTLTGLGGVGKTRLALRAAAGMRRAFPDGVWLVELGEVRDTGGVAAEVASALGLADDRDLVGFLSGRRLMLVLDTCEHLLGSCAELAGELLSASAGLRLLVTSRQPLGRLGERVLRVDPLAVPDPGPLEPRMLGHYDAVTLFLHRARAVDREFTVTDANCAEVVRLCRALDGIPLALELAAARLRTLTLTQVGEALADACGLLTTGNRAGPRRQRSLRASIGWSHRLCTPAERAVWSRLSVFAGGFDLAAAESVAGAGPGEVLSGLVEKSIVERAEVDGRTRYRMVEVIRQYGRDRLAGSGEQGATAVRHRDWFMRLVRQAEADWLGPDQLTWYRRIRAEGPNLRQALDFCLSTADGGPEALELATALCGHRRALGSLAEGRRWLERAIDQAAGPAPVRAKALWTTAWLALMQGDGAAARALLAECREIAERTQDASVRAHETQFSALADLFDGEFALAVTRFGEAIKRHREAGDQAGVRLSRFQLVMSRCFAGDPSAAASVKRARKFLRPDTEPAAHGYLSWYDAVERSVRRDRGDAAAPAKRALQIGAEIKDHWLVALALETLAWAVADAGEHLRAAHLFGAAEAARTALGCRLSGLAHLLAHHDRCAGAARSALGEEKFAAAYRSGTRMREQEAVAYAAAPRKPGAARGKPSIRSPLTVREREIADLVARGLSNQEIAGSLVIARRTAETHVGHILAKLGFTSRAQIAAWVAERPQPVR
ncbi:LuxR C-terminal-related transcriptional regulator [Amycolatopsis sp. PS_44_ISF1]|uniref:ATP-binding protein n=1 Tax=Amycolatopsis sp. PS_44_ISF1 TaxID=2974917 RepID=UPI0028DED08A|nr:LuxR C-terminal-related transcriptional regulator [Amycolatopsis sp. PS_44_ISF1]MDT8913145.1 LuxR C-terminal-related transcriptional regulator [Amycolatopsis sp. PS_44_ISF1]